MDLATHKMPKIRHHGSILPNIFLQIRESRFNHSVTSRRINETTASLLSHVTTEKHRTTEKQARLPGAAEGLPHPSNESLFCGLCSSEQPGPCRDLGGRSLGWRQPTGVLAACSTRTCTRGRSGKEVVNWRCSELN